MDNHVMLSAMLFFVVVLLTPQPALSHNGLPSMGRADTDWNNHQQQQHLERAPRADDASSNYPAEKDKREPSDFHVRENPHEQEEEEEETPPGHPRDKRDKRVKESLVCEMEKIKSWHFGVVGVSRTVTAAAVQFTIFFSDWELPTVSAYPVIWENSHDIFLAGEGLSVTLSGHKAVVTVPRDLAQEHVRVDLAHPNGYHSLYLSLPGRSNHSQSQNLPRISCSLWPWKSGQFTFYQDRDFPFEFMCFLSTASLQKSVQLSGFMLAKNGSTAFKRSLGQTTIDTKRKDHVLFLNMKKNTHYGEGVVQFNDFMTFVNCSGCFVLAYSIVEFVPFHHRTQLKPFPPGFSSFVHFPEKSGTNELPCKMREDKTCELVVEVVGRQPSAPDLVNGSNASSVGPARKVVSHKFDYFAFTTFLLANPRKEEYQSRSGSGNINVTLNFALSFYGSLKVQIQKNASTFIIFPNGDVQITCQADGLPLPRLWLIADTGNPKGRYYTPKGNDSTRVTELKSGYTSQTVIRIDHSQDYWKGYKHFHCLALQSIHHHEHLVSYSYTGLFPQPAPR